MKSEEIIANLNPAQLEAIMHIDGPSLVLAGAGSGKTRVITHKIARLIQSELEPSRILAISFTNKAAQEMKERVQKLVGRAAKQVGVSTFHSLGVRLLREDGELLGLKPKFSILDSQDVLLLIKDAGGTIDTATARRWQWTISQWKSSGLNASDAQKMVCSDEERVIATIMDRYEGKLLAYQSVDFDDLITLPLKLLREHESVREKWQNLFGHILVDEYQDTNGTQYELLKLLVGPPQKAHFTAVGDDDQSIYGWRGAKMENIQNLSIDFPKIKIIKLEQNYRSVMSVLRAANNVIELNPKLFVKNLWSNLGDGDPVSVLSMVNEEDEAANVVNRIKYLRSINHSELGNYQNFAVLYRANHQAKVIEKALQRAQIPYKVSGGQSFFERTEIRDLCAWFRLLNNENDDPAFIRAITKPKRGIGHQTLAKLGEFSNKYKISLFEALFTTSLHAIFNESTLNLLHEFGRYVNDIQFRFKQCQGAEEARKILLDWLSEMGYEKFLYETEDNSKQAQLRWNNILEFIDWVAKRCGGEHEGDGLMAKKKSLLEVTQTIALLSTLTEREKSQELVTLSTLHAAKGLEWAHVILVGVCEGILPFEQGEKGSFESFVQDDKELSPECGGLDRIQEERRLMYVGITRAQKTLQITWPQKRKKGREFINAKPSRFIGEMRLDEIQLKVDPREKLKILREQLAAKSEENKQRLMDT